MCREKQTNSCNRNDSPAQILSLWTSPLWIPGSNLVLTCCWKSCGGRQKTDFHAHVWNLSNTQKKVDFQWLWTDLVDHLLDEWFRQGDVVPKEQRGGNLEKQTGARAWQSRTLCQLQHCLHVLDKEKMKLGLTEANDTPFYSCSIYYNQECPWKLYITVHLKGHEGALPLPGRWTLA